MIQNTFFIVRHGESENNVLGIESSKLENINQFGLSDTGKKETENEARKLEILDLNPQREKNPNCDTWPPCAGYTGTRDQGF